MCTVQQGLLLLRPKPAGPVAHGRGQERRSPWRGAAAAVDFSDRQRDQAGEWVREDQGEARYSIWTPGEGEAHRRRASTVAGGSAGEDHGGRPEGRSKAPGVRPASSVGRWRSSGTRPLVWTVAEGGRRWGGARNKGSGRRNSTSGLPRGRRRLEDEETEGGGGGRRRRSSGEAARGGGQWSHEEATVVGKTESAVGARACTQGGERHLGLVEGLCVGIRASGARGAVGERRTWGGGRRRRSVMLVVQSAR
jgi:hypothetical protein